jgi:dipeptidyl aminopeptidase/acylaminoacyl peptidase
MKRFLSATTAMIICMSSANAQVATPDRAVTDPQSVASPVNPEAREVPLEDISASNGLRSAAWSADGTQIFISTNLSGRFNIWRMDAGGGWPVRMTQSDEVQDGIVTSRDGQYVYFEQDTGGNEYADVFRVPANGGAVQNLTNTPERAETNFVVGPIGGLIAMSIKLKSEGQSNIAVMDPSGAIRSLTQEADPQFTWFPRTWSGDGKYLYAERESVNNTTTEIWQINVATGQATSILASADTIYEVGDVSADGQLIAVNTSEGGQIKAGLYNIAARTWQWLSATQWEQRANAFVKGESALIFEVNADGRNTLYELDIASGAETPLAVPAGFSSLIGSPALAPDGRQMMILRSAADTPTNLFVYDTQTEQLAQPTQLAIASLRAEALPKSEIVTYESFDGTLISAVVTMPANLERDGSNPAIVIPHGGPAGQSRDNYSAYSTAFASRGYVVIRPNFRGSTGYGTDFVTANYQDLGGGDLKDTIGAKQFLVETAYVDADRVGIFGGSYGGFMTLMALGKTPDEFAAGVQLYGIINWRTMYRDQDERLKAYQRSLLGTPDENPDVYDASSPLTYIRNAKAPLLTIQGENDIRVPRGQAQEIDDILRAQGNIVETIFYPEEGHGFRKRENQIDSLERTIAWFDKYLKGKAD